MPFGIKEYHKDIASLHVGTESPRAYYIPYASRDEASTAWRAPTDNDRIIRKRWQAEGLDRLETHCCGTTLAEDENSTRVTALLSVGAEALKPAAHLTVTYTVCPETGITVHTEAKIGERVPERETTVIFDYRNSAVGSASCGPELDEALHIKEKEFSFTFKIKPVFSGNILPFKEM